jgi:dipeptidyl aminopeptidase/acylaminoacyl peptidase
MKKESIDFKSDNLTLYGQLFSPVSIDYSRQALCICHGISAGPYNPEEPGYALLAEQFCNHGFITLIFNFRGAGLSEGNLDLTGWTHDLKAAIDFLYLKEDVRRSGLALIGSSGGGAVSIYVAAHDDRVSAVATLACPASFEELFPGAQAEPMISHFRSIGVIKDKAFPESTERWLEGFYQLSPVTYVSRISPRPLLIIHGDNDDLVPLEHARILYQQAGEPKELAVIPGAGHRLRTEPKAIDAVLNWLKMKK